MSDLTPERWKVVKAALTEALERCGPERTEFLSRLGSDDPQLRRELDELLSGEAAADSLTSALAAAVVSASGELASEVGMLVGPYRLEAEIGRGGMGTVHLARRVDGQYDARVAIKLVRRDVDSAEAANRFRLERQYLAVLEHPSIARLLDGGITTDGRLYLVLEYVDGEPIDSYCTAQALGLQPRLKLFRQVCAAVEYAHQRLIVHRDLKPSNVLVGSGGTPKLVDFGIAKLLAPGPTTTTTQDATRFLTPAFASPEHRAGGTITTASDVYSLGVLLHVLLAGRLPQFAGCQGADAPSEALPVSRAAADVTVPAGPVGTDELQGDLDRIVAKALQSSPEERYRSVAELDEDVRRYLAGEPILARVPTAGYRLHKWAARNRALAATVAISMLVGVAGVLAIVWQVHRTSMARMTAEQAEQRARKRFEDVRRLAHAVIYDYSDAIEQLSGSIEVRQRLVQDALDYLGSLAADSRGDFKLQAELAAAYVKIGDIQGRRWMSNLGRVGEAEESYRKAAALYEEIDRGVPHDLDHQLQVARLWIGPIAFSSVAHNDLASAISAGRRGVAIANELAVRFPEEQRVQVLLVEIEQIWTDVYLNFLGDAQQAQVHAVRCRQLAEARAQANPQELEAQVALAYCDGWLASTLSEGGRHSEAVEHRRASVERLQRLLAGHETELLRLGDVAVGLGRLGAELADEAPGGPSMAEALDVSSRAVQSMGQLYEANRENGLARSRFSQVLRLRARVTLAAGHPMEAAVTAERAVVLAGALDDANSGVVTHAPDLAAARLLQGEVLERLGRPTEARAVWQAARDVLGRLTSSEERRPARWEETRARAMEAILEPAPEGAAVAARAVQELELLADLDPESVAKKRELVRLYRSLARRTGEGHCLFTPWARKAAALSRAIEEGGRWLGSDAAPDARSCR